MNRLFYAEVKICPVCGKEFPSDHNKKYCSPQCSRLGKRRGYYPLYDSRKRRLGLTERQKKILYAFYGHKCAICGWDNCSCQLHHITPIKDGGNNSLRNLILLCPNHHAEADEGILPKEELESIANSIIDTLYV